MIMILGLIILISAVIAGTAGVLGNTGSGHASSHPFTMLGYHVTGSAGTLFLYGIAVGALAMLGLSLLPAVTRDRGNLPGQREAGRPDLLRSPMASGAGNPILVRTARAGRGL